MGGGKGSNIKSYLRIKPNKNTTFKPMEIYNNQTIICDRSVYKFDFIFEPETPQVHRTPFRRRFTKLWGKM